MARRIKPEKGSPKDLERRRKKREYDQQYRKARPEKMYDRNKKWRKAHPDIVLASNNKYRKKFPDKVKMFPSSQTEARSRSYQKNIVKRKEYLINNADRLLAKRREQENIERFRELHILREYKLSKQEHIALLEKQGYTCAMKPLCNKPVTYLKSAVDHDHNTGHVRGVLCIRHNTALAAFGDTLEGLESPKAYLVRAQHEYEALQANALVLE